MNIERGDSRRLLLVAGVAVALLILVVLAVRQTRRLGLGNEKIWVASAGLVPGATVGPSDLRFARLKQADNVPGAIRARDEIQGRQLARSKEAGAPFTADDFVTQRDTGLPSISESIPEGRVLVPLRITPYLFRAQQLRRGDRIDILGAPRGEPARLVARDAYLMGQSASGRVQTAATKSGPFGISLGGGEGKTPPPLYMYLAVHPEDALPLSQAQSSGTSLKLVMHAKSDVAAGRVSDLGSDERQVVEVIRGGDRESVPVAY